MAVELYGKPTTIPKLLTAINTLLVDGMSFDPAAVFESFDDENLDHYPAMSPFVQIAPKQASIDQGVVTGGLFQTDLQVAVNLWFQLGMDVAYIDSALVRDETYGMLTPFRLLLSTLQQCVPVDGASETQALVTEPARCLGFEFRPRRQRNAFAILRSWWSFPCVLDLS